MSSFRRRVTTVSIPGTRPSPYNSLALLSTGLTSLDDILGGGIPLSTSILIEQDTPTAYADLLLNFWIAQGLECNHETVVVTSGVDATPEDIVKILPGLEGASSEGPKETKGPKDAAEGGGGSGASDKMKIAFRYEHMKQHAVSVSEPSATPSNGDTYCSLFDLTTTRPLRSSDKQLLHLINASTFTSHDDRSSDPYEGVLERLSSIITEGGYSIQSDSTKPKKVLRIAISAFSSPAWGPASPQSLYIFVNRLRRLLRSSSASALITFPAHLFRPRNASLVNRIEHASDGVIELQSFADSPSSLISFPRHNGLLRISRLPSLGGLVPPSVKLSVLRGLGGSEGMDNNLGFRVKRRRFVVETVNGDGPAGGDAPPAPRKEEQLDPAQQSPAATTRVSSLKTTTVQCAGEGETEKGFGQGSRTRTTVSRIIHTNPELLDF
ncbi:PAXNEB-domain-containing protein [Meredithblackwellia eburnea MCA 4105]